MDPGQGRYLLTIDGDGCQPLGFREGAWSAGARQIGYCVAFFNAAYPTMDGFRVGCSEKGDGSMLDASHTQSYNYRPALDSALHGGAGFAGVRMFLKAWHRMCHAQEDFPEVFLLPLQAVVRIA